MAELERMERELNYLYQKEWENNKEICALINEIELYQLVTV